MCQRDVYFDKSSEAMCVGAHFACFFFVCFSLRLAAVSAGVSG